MNSFFAPILFIQFLFLLASCNSTKTTTIEFSDGSYQGEIDKKGKKNGKGIYVWHDGSTYEGDFKEDSRHGNGYFKWRNMENHIKVIILKTAELEKVSTDGQMALITKGLS